jgi:hypothetical protein
MIAGPGGAAESEGEKRCPSYLVRKRVGAKRVVNLNASSSLHLQDA